MFFSSIAEIPGWEADVGPGRQSMVVHLTSSAPANFSAQLCVLTEVGCTPVGSVHSVAMVSINIHGNKTIQFSFTKLDMY